MISIQSKLTIPEVQQPKMLERTFARPATPKRRWTSRQFWFGDGPINVVPYFAQAPLSYMQMPTLPNAYMEFDIEKSFKPESPDGLILYNGQQAGGSGDFISFGLNNGFPEFRFDVGAGPAVIKSDRDIDLGKWHTVKLSRNRKNEFIYF